MKADIPAELTEKIYETLSAPDDEEELVSCMSYDYGYYKYESRNAIKQLLRSGAIVRMGNGALASALWAKALTMANHIYDKELAGYEDRRVLAEYISSELHKLKRELV